jgi:hypothetical protein
MDDTGLALEYIRKNRKKLQQDKSITPKQIMLDHDVTDMSMYPEIASELVKLRTEKDAEKQSSSPVMRALYRMKNKFTR